MTAPNHLLRYSAEPVHFLITYKRGGFKLPAYSEANWGNNRDNGKSTSSYIIMLTNDPINFYGGLQSLTAQSTMEAELMAAALVMKEVGFCSNMRAELGFKKRFRSVPLCLDDTSALHGADNCTCCPRAKHNALRYVFIQDLVEEGKITIHYMNTQDKLADLGPKHVGKHCYRALIKLINDFKT